MPEPEENLKAQRFPRRFITASRLSSVKRLHLAIRAFSALYPKHRDTELWIAGDGENRHDLENLASESPGAGAIRFLGDLDRRAVASMMRGAIALLLPSISEGFPLGALESLACGTPVICSPVGYLGSLVRHGRNGFHVDAESIESTVTAMESSLSCYPLLSPACLESARLYSPTIVAPVIMAALEEACRS